MGEDFMIRAVSGFWLERTQPAISASMLIGFMCINTGSCRPRFRTERDNVLIRPLNWDLCIYTERAARGKGWVGIHSSKRA